MYASGHTRDGLRCCGTGWAWKELDYRVVGDRWYWLCPTCGEIIGSLPWKPPADTPGVVGHEAA